MNKVLRRVCSLSVRSGCRWLAPQDEKLGRCSNLHDNVQPYLPVGCKCFSSLPQFTSLNGQAPNFTAGSLPVAKTSMPSPKILSDAWSAEPTDEDWSDPDEKAETMLDQVRQAALSHVAERGWTNASLVAGARDVGVSPAICGSLPNGATDLVQYFVRQCNHQLASNVASEAGTLHALPLQQKLHTLLRWRLESIKPFLDSWPSAMALLARPTAATASLQLLNELVDEVWHAAGDTSADLTWYAKRAALGSVYTATELYMLTDFSSDTNDTWKALDRQLAGMLTLSSRSPVPFV